MNRFTTPIPIYQLTLIGALLFPLLSAGCGSGGSSAGPSGTAGDPSTTQPTSTSTQSASSSGVSRSTQVAVPGGGAVQLTLSATAASYASGTPIPMQLRVQNVGSTTIAFATEGPQADAVVTDGSGKGVWDYLESINGADDGGIVNQTLAPGQSTSDSFTWDQTNQTTGLAPGTPGSTVAPGSYSVTAYWELASINGFGQPLHEAGEPASAPITITIQSSGTTPPPPPPTPAAPTNLAATSDSSGVHLSWTAAANAATYNIYARVASLPYSSPARAQISGTAYTMPITAPGQTLYYEVSGVNSAGVEGPRSNEVSAIQADVYLTPPAGP